MISREDAFGRMCRTMIRNDPRPMNLAASTYSRSLMDRVSERTTRADSGQANTASSTARMIQAASPSGAPRDATAIRKKLGTTSSRSTIHSANFSHQPPR